MTRRKGGVAKLASRFTLRGQSRPRDLFIPALGELEAEAMREAWARGEVSVHDVHRALGGGRAYTTVMTTMDRLFRKGLLSRRKERHSYVYRPRLSGEELRRVILLDIADGLLELGPEGRRLLMTRAVETAGDGDGPLLEEVERLARERRLELGRTRAASTTERRAA